MQILQKRAPQSCRRNDVPRELRGLHHNVFLALRPLDIDAGRYLRGDTGYRYHAAMLRLAWSAQSVMDKIGALETRAERRQAQMAYTYLMNSDASHYWWFVEEHNSYLAANPDATEQQRKKPLRFIETLGVECALWPDLYPPGDMCETHVRLADTRRLQRQRQAGDEFEPEADDEVGEGAEQRHSLRRSFLAKVLSLIKEYSGDFELLQFMHDLSIWSDFGSKVNGWRCAELLVARILEGPAHRSLGHVGATRVACDV